MKFARSGADASNVRLSKKAFPWPFARAIAVPNSEGVLLVAESLPAATAPKKMQSDYCSVC
jgi:hypothetical protein